VLGLNLGSTARILKGLPVVLICQGVTRLFSRCVRVKSGQYSKDFKGAPCCTSLPGRDKTFHLKVKKCLENYIYGKAGVLVPYSVFF
jgi:hypothetical protein